jgi:hypothetical protein
MEGNGGSVTMHFDYDKFPILGRPPQTLHEHFRADPRGADSFGKWIEDRIWDLLMRPADLMLDDTHGSAGWYTCKVYDAPLHNFAEGSTINTAAHALLAAHHEHKHYETKTRVVLFDGTVIKEWPQR